jgi:polyphenol oxidase
MNLDGMSVKFGFSVEKKGNHPNLIEQVHGTKIVELPQANLSAPLAADGAWTRQPGLEIYVFTADCLPVLLWERDRISAVHAGWRGTKSGIVRNAVRELSRPRIAQAVLGPCIGPCCFEVKADFVGAFEAERGDIAHYLSQRESKTYFDLVNFVVTEDLDYLEPANIDLTHWRCTVCSSPQLPSFRRNGNTDTRIRSWIRIES